MSADTVYHSPCRTGSVMVHATPQCRHLQQSATLRGEAPLEAPADAFSPDDRCPTCFGVEYSDPVVGDHLAACRAVADLDPETLADAVGVHPQTVTNWENESTPQSGTMATSVREALAAHGVDVGAFADVTIDPPLGDALRAKRHARGWTQTELADRVGVGQRHISNWECGDCTPERINAFWLQRAFDGGADR